METDEDISNNEKALREIPLDKEVYETTRYLLVGNKKRGFAILEVKKEKSNKLFRKIVSVNVLALAKESASIDDLNVDVLNPNQLVPLALKTHRKSGKKATIVSGKYGHVSFALVRGKTELDTIEVVDVVPPRPGKLASMVEEAAKVGLIDSAVDIKVREIDLIQLAQKTKDKGAEVVIFPCKSSEITPQSVGAKTSFLDKKGPPISKKEYGKLGLVGCDVSLETFQHFSGRDFDTSKIVFEQMCPKKAVPDKLPFITKCCKQRDGYKPILERGALGVVVPWGARLTEVSEALNWLLHEMKRRA